MKIRILDRFVSGRGGRNVGERSRSSLAQQEIADQLLQTEQALRQAERDGLRISVLGRTVILSAIGLWLIFGAFTYGTTILTGLAIVLVYLAGGLILMRYMARGGDMLTVYAFVAVEIGALGILATQVELAASGGVPQILVFRTSGVIYLLFLIASWALTLLPGLVLWAGAVSCAALWGAFFWIVSGMSNTLSWADFPAGGAGEDYVKLLLSPDFIGVGNRIEETFVILGVSALIALAVHRARGFLRQRAMADARQLKTLEIFGQYVPPDIAERLVESLGGLAPRTLEGTVLFADIVGFTRFSEHRAPGNVIRTMTEVFDLATEAVMGAGGLVAGFAGDALIAAFTLADAPERSAQAATEAARIIQRQMALRRFDGDQLTMRIGIASGSIAAGSVGGGKHRAYTVYGDPVNLSQRLQELGKTLGVELLICETTWRRAGLDDAVVDHGIHEIRGRSQSVRVLELK